jgi:hypothetical protein
LFTGYQGVSIGQNWDVISIFAANSSSFCLDFIEPTQGDPSAFLTKILPAIGAKRGSKTRFSSLTNSLKKIRRRRSIAGAAWHEAKWSAEGSKALFREGSSRTGLRVTLKFNDTLAFGKGDCSFYPPFRT